MASFTGKSGKCSNFGNCSLADARTTVEVPNGQDFVCTECGKPLLLMDAGPQAGGNSKALVVGALLLVLLLAAGGIGWSLMSGKKAPESPPPVAVEQPQTLPKTEPAAQPPVSGNCSEADERVGLCRRPAP
jgi:phosphate transport system substrate-binding protein